MSTSTTINTVPPLRIAVVGGGIAGLTSALALLHLKVQGANISVHVYESAVAAGDEEHDSDTWFDFHIGEKGEKSRQYITTIKGTNAAKGSVHRADFLSCLIHQYPQELAHFHHRATAYTLHEGGVTVHFGESHGHPAQPDIEADVVIASDGVKSILRHDMYAKAGIDLNLQEAKYSEWIAWRGLIPVEKFTEALGPETNNKLMIIGHGKHILTFPVKKGAMINIVGFVRDESHVKLGNNTGPWSEERPKAELLADYESFNEETFKLLNAIEKPSIWGIFDLPELHKIYDDRVILTGDAAHGTTPHQGSGAGQAVEDALFISSILAHPKVANAPLTNRVDTIRQALKVYIDARQGRGTQVVTTSYQAGLLYEMLGPEGDDLEKIKANLDGRMSWIWDWDTQSELDKALARL